MIISPKFSATIRLVSEEAFNRRIHEGVAVVGKPWEIDQMAIGKPAAYTTSASICTIGGVQAADPGANRFLLFHLLPAYVLEETDTVRHRLTAEIRKLKTSLQEAQPLKGLLLGGSHGHDNSRKSFNLLSNVLRQSGVQPSVIWGQKEWGCCDAYYNAQEDTWLISTKDSHWRDVQDLETLRRQFAIVNVAPGDRLETTGNGEESA